MFGIEILGDFVLIIYAVCMSSSQKQLCLNLVWVKLADVYVRNIVRDKKRKRAEKTVVYL